MKFKILVTIEHLFHWNLKPIGLVIEVEAANENLPSKKARYKHVLAILQELKIFQKLWRCPNQQEFINPLR
jgi:hypothetical protein